MSSSVTSPHTVCTFPSQFIEGDQYQYMRDSEICSVIQLILPIAPSAPPQGLSGNALGPTQISLSWSPPPAIDINGVLLYYDIAVTELETGQQWVESSTEQQLTVAALHQYYNYQFAVAALTIGRGPYSSVLELQTLESCKLTACYLDFQEVTS